MAQIKGPFWDGKRYQFAIPDRIELMLPIGMALTGEPSKDEAARLNTIRSRAMEIVAICDEIEKGD
jgi:hypothetical protein